MRISYPHPEYLLLAGGSSCAGKTTLCRELSVQYGMPCFSIDDHLGEYARKGQEKGLPVCLHQQSFSAEEFWMRDPAEMCAELIGFYREIFPFVMEDIFACAAEGPLIAEGIALMPDLVMRELPRLREAVFQHQAEYICMTAEKSFQIRHFREREWVPLLLEGCRDKEQAFSNWMKREVLFGESVKQMAENLGCRLFVASEEEADPSCEGC